MTAKKDAFVSGIKSIAPLMVGVFPFAGIVGITIVEVGIDPLPAMAMSIIIYAGASQIAISDLIGKGAPFIVIVFTAIIINLRFTMYSASIAPHLKKTSTLGKYILAYMLTDHAYALSMARFNRSPDDKYKIWFYAGCTIFMWFVWQIGTILGIYLGLLVPDSWSVGFAIPLSFLALLIPNIKDVAAGAAAVVSGLIAVFALKLPMNMGVIIAAICGIAFGFMVETIMEKEETHT